MSVVISQTLCLAKIFRRLTVCRNRLNDNPPKSLAPADNIELQDGISRIHTSVTTKAFLELFAAYHKGELELSEHAGGRDISVVRPGDVLIPNVHHSFSHYHLSDFSGYELPKHGKSPFTVFYIFLSMASKNMAAVVCLLPEYDVFNHKAFATFFDLTGRKKGTVVSKNYCNVNTIWAPDTQFLRFKPSERIAAVIKEAQRLIRIIQVVQDENKGAKKI